MKKWKKNKKYFLAFRLKGQEVLLGLPSESKNPIIAYINVPFGYLNLKRHASWNVKMLVLFLRHNYADAYMSFFCYVTAISSGGAICG